MRYVELMTEAAAPTVIDFRVPDLTTFEPSWGGTAQPVSTCFVLGKNATVIYNEPIGTTAKVNQREWEIDPTIAKLVPNEWHGSMVSSRWPTFRFKDGKLIMAAPHTYERQGGVTNRYSKEVISAAGQFIKRGLLPAATPMYLRTADFAFSLGTLDEVATHTEQHDLILYHGTTSGRAQQILRDGLRPMAGDVAHRQWREKTSPEWRETAIYLTASPEQAAVYATRAVTNARKRREKGQKPAVLQVRIDSGLFDHIRPDDDYLRAMGTDAKDWRHSLGHYGQVAVVSPIPANHITLTGIGVKARRAFPASENGS
jgi:hypothetical protein